MTLCVLLGRLDRGPGDRPAGRAGLPRRCHQLPENGERGRGPGPGPGPARRRCFCAACTAGAKHRSRPGPGNRKSRRRRRRTAAGQGCWPSPWFVVMPLGAGIRGASYLTRLHILVTSNSSTAHQVIGVVLFVLIEFLLIIIPFTFLELRPEATKARLTGTQAWAAGLRPPAAHGLHRRHPGRLPGYQRPDTPERPPHPRAAPDCTKPAAAASPSQVVSAAGSRPPRPSERYSVTIRKMLWPASQKPTASEPTMITWSL